MYAKFINSFIKKWLCGNCFKHKSPARKSSMTVNVMEVSEDKKACSTEKAKHAKVCMITTSQHLHILSITVKYIN